MIYVFNYVYQVYIIQCCLRSCSQLKFFQNYEYMIYLIQITIHLVQILYQISNDFLLTKVFAYQFMINSINLLQHHLLLLTIIFSQLQVCCSYFFEVVICLLNLTNPSNFLMLTILNLNYYLLQICFSNFYFIFLVQYQHACYF